MNSESRLLVDIWDVVGDQFSKAQRVDAVISILRAFQEFGIDPEEFEEACEEDPYIQHGYDAVVEKDDYIGDEEDED